MKKLLIIVAILVIPSICLAALAKDTGSKELNRYLHGLSTEVATGTLNKSELKTHITDSFGIAPKSLKQMERRGLEPGELYLVGLIHKASGARVSRIVYRAHSLRRSWKDVIYYFGITPEELDVMRVADEKAWKKNKKKTAHKARKNKKRAKAGKTNMELTTSDKVCECVCSAKKR